MERNMQDFKTLETFVAVATLGGFRAAAERLNTTQPAVSQRIAQLEHRYGARLLERTSRVVTLTEKGREFLAYAERILRLAAEMRIALSEPGAIRGTLRLGVAETIVHSWLPGFIGHVARQHPAVAVEIEVDTSPLLRERLIGKEIDLAFLLGPLTDPLARNLPLNRVPLAFLASPDFVLPATPLSIAALAQQPLITFARHTRPHAALRTLLARSDLPPPRIHASAALAPVVRLADAKPLELGHCAKADGRWRLIAFADAGEPFDACPRQVLRRQVARLAERGWTMMKAKFPQLQDRNVVITEAVVNGRTFWRIAADGFGAQSAKAMCGTIKSSGRGCFAYAASSPPAGAVQRDVRMAARAR